MTPQKSIYSGFKVNAIAVPTSATGRKESTGTADPRC